MHADLALRMTANLLWTGLTICLPVLAVILVVGLAISLLQVVTQVQEMSLTFVPKLLATGVVLIAMGPWMLRKLTSYAAQLWASIPTLF
ncbi:flagellar biosynthetic protein FliQ [Ralstonia sp. 24A2]|uniref:flagellar biosynthetic protein FliQ n=1 Tax=Ralstonia sp. 24A2 TaxID=3447364 RepID=UPI003F6975A9